MVPFTSFSSRRVFKLVHELFNHIALVYCIHKQDAHLIHNIIIIQQSHIIHVHKPCSLANKFGADLIYITITYTTLKFCTNKRRYNNYYYSHIHNTVCCEHKTIQSKNFQQQNGKGQNLICIFISLLLCMVTHSCAYTIIICSHAFVIILYKSVPLPDVS